MPHQSMGRGTFILDRTFSGVGRIHRASGTTDPDVFDRINAMLDDFASAARTDLLTALRDGKVRATVLFESYRRHGLSLKFSAEAAVPILTALNDWLPRADLVLKTKAEYRYVIERIAGRRRVRHGAFPFRWDVVTPPAAARASLLELPDLLRKFRERAKPRLFNLARSAAQALVRDVVPEGRYSEIWRKVSAIPSKSVRRRKGNPQPVDRARVIAEALGLDGAMWWTLCCTGMGWKEYAVDGWEVLPDRVRIFGEKREHRDRVVPRLCTPVQPMCHEKTFQAKLAKAVRELAAREAPLAIGRLTIYDARRTFRHWMEEAGIPKARREAYMGHAAGDLDALYGELGDATLDHYLPGDRDRLLKYVGREPMMLRVVG